MHANLRLMRLRVRARPVLVCLWRIVAIAGWWVTQDVFQGLGGLVLSAIYFVCMTYVTQVVIPPRT